MKTGRPGCPGEKGVLTKGVEIVHNGGGIVLKGHDQKHKVAVGDDLGFFCGHAQPLVGVGVGLDVFGHRLRVGVFGEAHQNHRVGYRADHGFGDHALGAFDVVNKGIGLEIILIERDGGRRNLAVDAFDELRHNFVHRHIGAGVFGLVGVRAAGRRKKQQKQGKGKCCKSFHGS